MEEQKSNDKEDCVLEEKKRILDEDDNAYKVLAMLFEPIVSEEFQKIKEEEKKVSVIPALLAKESTDYRPRI